MHSLGGCLQGGVHTAWGCLQGGVHTQPGEVCRAVCTHSLGGDCRVVCTAGGGGVAGWCAQSQVGGGGGLQGGVHRVVGTAGDCLHDPPPPPVVGGRSGVVGEHCLYGD